MVTKYKDVIPKKNVCDVFKSFFSERGQLPYISSVFFLGRIILKHIENEKGSRESGGMLPRTFFENLHAVVAILALSEQFLHKFCLNFCP